MSLDSGIGSICMELLKYHGRRSFAVGLVV
jgi:hypothetical protein